MGCLNRILKIVNLSLDPVVLKKRVFELSICSLAEKIQKALGYTDNLIMTTTLIVPVPCSSILLMRSDSGSLLHCISISDYNKFFTLSDVLC